MARKKKEPVVIQPTELIPTTIGTFQIKDNGPWVVILIVVFFLVGIFFLDDISEFIRNPDFSQLLSSHTNEPDDTVTTPVVPNPDKEVTYYTFQDDLKISLDDFLFSDFKVNGETLTFVITNNGKDADLFRKNNYYVELYSSSNMLLQRIKIANQSIKTTQNFSFDISNGLKNGSISKIAIVLKEESDYPPAKLKKVNDNLYSLTCQMKEKELEYFFTKKDTTYPLTAFEERVSYLSSNDDYTEVLDQYDTLSMALKDEAGIDVKLSALKNGLEYSSYVNLAEVSKQTLQRYFNDFVYFSVNEDAKVVAFEMESSGYSCE